MLIWTGVHGEVFKFQIIGYQFPSIVEGYDANWLIAEVEGANELGTWSKRDPSLLTWEVAWFSRWLRNVVKGNAYDDALAVYEQTLEFHYLAPEPSYHRFAICLRNELSFYESSKQMDSTSIIVVRVSDAQIREAVEYFDSVLRTYPPRGEQGKTSLEKLPGPRVLEEGSRKTLSKD
jgi:hypothetical protein